MKRIILFFTIIFPSISQASDDTLALHQITFGQKILLDGCKSGSKDQIKNMLLDRLNPNFQDPSTNLTALATALHHHHISIAKLLLINGADPYAYLSDTETAYSQSFKDGNIEAIHFFKENKILPYTTDDQKDLTSRKEHDIIRLINAKKLNPLKHAFIYQLLHGADITPRAIRLARKLAKEDREFDYKILLFLKKIARKETLLAAAKKELPSVSSDTKSELLKCAICLEKLNKKKTQYRPIALLCGDVFHTKCINPWLEEHSTCPLCKREHNEQPTDVSLLFEDQKK